MFTYERVFVYNNVMNFEIFLKDCDCAILTSPASLYYLSGFDQSDAIIVITKENAYYLTNPLYEVAVKGAVRRDLTVKILSRKAIAAFVRAHADAAEKVGVECEDISLARYRALIGSFNREIVDLSPILAKARLRKRRDELAIMKRAEGIVDLAFSETLASLKAGVTEKEIRDRILFSLLKHGAEGTAFDTIVAFGENAAMPHAVPSDRALKEGDCVLMDFGARYKGYASDFTRTVCFGKPSEKFLEAYRVVLAAQNAAITYLKKGGRSAAEADRAARRVVDDSPFHGAFNHTLGHGVGIEIHEAPSLAEHSLDILEENMVFTLEPGIYVEGEFGIRIESLVTIENGQLTVIDRSDKEIYIV